MKHIPKVIHQIWWQGINKIPDKYQSFRQSWIDNHKGWNVICWDKKKILELVKFYYPHLLKLIKFYPNMIQKIDMAKYIILYHHGGFYVDMDTICNKSLKNLYNIPEYQKYNFICSKMEIVPFIKIINNGIIFSKPRHPLLKILISNLEKNKEQLFYQNQDLYIMESTGPIFYNDLIEDYDLKDVLILPEDFLESCTMLDYPNCKKKGEYLTHQHTLSWSTQNFKNMFLLIKIIYFMSPLLLLFSLLFIIKLKKNSI